MEKRKSPAHLIVCGLIVIAVAILSSCAGIGHDAYLNALPDDFQAAVKIEPQILFDKAFLKDNSNFRSLKRDAADELLDDIETSSLRVKAKEILDDAYQTGLDFSKPAIATLKLGGKSGAALVMAVKDFDKLKELCKMLEREVDDYEEFECEEYSEGCYIGGSEDEGLIIAFNSKSFVVYCSERSYNASKDYAAILLKQESIINDSDSFRAFIKNGDDIGAWADCGNLYRAASRDMDYYLKEKLEVLIPTQNVDDCYLTAGISFENGQMVIKTKGEYSEYMTQQSKDLFAKADNSLFKYLPGNAFMAANVNTSKLASVVSSLPSDGRRNFKDLCSDFGLTLDDFKGNASIALVYDQDEYEIEYAFAMELDDEAYNNFKEEMAEDMDDNDLSISYHDGVMCVVSDALLSKCHNGEFNSSFKSSSYASAIADGGFVIDINKLGKDLYDIVDEDWCEVLEIADYLTSLQFIYPSYDSFNIVLKTKNENENILATTSRLLLNAID